MKILSAQEIRDWEAFTILTAKISSSDLMERAAIECAKWLSNELRKSTLFVVICGPGNNGGDGLAIARHLHKMGFATKSFILAEQSSLSEDSQANANLLSSMGEDLMTYVESGTFISDIPQHVVIIDALFGTGLNRPLGGWLKHFVNKVNELPNRRISIDLPSGLPADIIPVAGSTIIHADDTLTFQCLKRTFLHAETGGDCGNIHILDIGLNADKFSNSHTTYNTIDEKLISSIYKPRLPFTHKGTYGHAMIIGGSYGKGGSMAISATAGLRAGAGLLTALVPKCAYDLLQISIPEVMCLTSGEQCIEQITGWEKMKSIGIGPGMGRDERTKKALTEFLEKCRVPIVLDADALNIISENQALLSKMPADSILTPHPLEFSRIFGTSIDSLLQLELARTQAMKYNINIVLKGHHTAVVTSSGECFYNMTGNAGMATAGSGDMLTGIIVGLMAQSYQPKDAALLGVFLHGLAGDFAAGSYSQEALIAHDMIDQMGKAFLKISHFGDLPIKAHTQIANTAIYTT